VNSKIELSTKGAGTGGRIKSGLEKVVRCVAVVLVIALMVGIAFYQFSRAHSSDFTQFYCAAQMVRRGLGSSLYDLTKQIEFQSRVARVQVFYNHPPFEALLFVPFTYVSYRAAYLLWTITSLSLLIIAVFLIEAGRGITSSISQFMRVRVDVGLVTVVFLTFAPATTCLLLGQDSMLMLVIYSAAFVLLKRGSDFRAGCVLACGLFKFQLILPFALILLLRHKWSALRGLGLVGTLLVMISVGISGAGVLSAYPRFLFDSTYQSIGGFAPEFMPNIRGLSFVLSRGKLAGLAFGVLVAACSIVVLWYAARNWQDEQLPTSFAASVLATLLSSYHLYNYDLTLLLLPIAILFTEMVRRGLSLGRSAIGTALILLFIPPLHRLLLLHSIYPLMGVPVAILYWHALRLGRTGPSSAHSEPSLISSAL
jgi:Glycosyltransferase family 87